MKNSYPSIRKVQKLLLTRAIPLFLLTSHAGAVDHPAVTLTDRQGRSLDVIVLTVNDDKIRVRRVADGREFSLPVENLSDESREKLRGIKNPEPPEAAANPPVEIDLPDEVLAYMRGEWQAARSQIADPTLPRTVSHCWQVSMLITLENDLVAAATPKDPASPIDWPDWVAPEVRREAETLKQRIRDAQRLRIFKAAGLVTESMESPQPDHIDMLRLADLYDETAKVQRERRHIAQQTLLREKKASQPKAEMLRSLEEKVKTATESISALHKAFYGFSLGEWLRPDPSWPADHPAEILRKEIRTLRVALYTRLSVTEVDASEGEARINEIGRSEHGKLHGLVLQLSPKMSSHLESLYKDHGHALRFGLSREVVGCNLVLRHEITVHTHHGRPANTLEAIEELIMVHKPDTIHWLCDFEKAYSWPGLLRLRDLVRMSDVRFHMKSIGEKPDEQLEKLIYPF